VPRISCFCYMWASGLVEYRKTYEPEALANGVARIEPTFVAFGKGF